MSVMGIEQQIQNRHRHWRFTMHGYDTLLPPGPLAEYLEPEIALAGMRHCMTLRKPEGHFHSAWHHIEYALNQRAAELDDGLRRKYIDDASYLLACITGHSAEIKHEVSPNLYAQAMTLSIYLPVLRKRALGRDVEREDCENIYLSFGTLFDDLARMKTGDSSYKPARFAEMLSFALSARTLQPDLLMYPSSPREEASSGQGFNHDGYFIRDSEKLPVQAKLDLTEKIYEQPTSILYLEPLARHALTRAQCIDLGDELAFGDATLILSELVQNETTHNDATAYEKRALDFATRSIASRYRFSYENQLSA